MSESSPAPPASRAEAYAEIFAWGRRFLRPIRRVWALFRQSRLALVGLGIVLVFAFLGIFAPVISPYPPDFEAPASDRFLLASYPQALLAGHTYRTVTLGPTTPTVSDKQGGMWVLVPSEEGLIQMFFLRGHDPAGRLTPFEAGNLTMTVDVRQDFGLAPLPGLPLRHVFFAVPAVNSTGQTGPRERNGAIAFLAGRDFVFADPFSKAVVFRDTLDFDPLWMGQDPRSSGEMYIMPSEKAKSIGIAELDWGAYRYFYAATPARAVVFEVTYVHATDVNPPPARGPVGRVVMDVATSLSQAPFVYYGANITAADEFRSGAGQAIVLPLANRTLEVYTVNGTFRASVPLTLEGRPATVAGPIGYVRSEYPPLLYLPLASDRAVGLAAFDLSTLRVRWAVALGDPGWEVDLPPFAVFQSNVHFAAYDPAAGVTRLFQLDETGARTAGFEALAPGRAQTWFFVEQLSRIFLFSEAGKILNVDASFRGPTPAPLEDFPVNPSTANASVRYAGALGGTLFGTGLTQEELFGIWVDPSEREIVVFQLQGTIRTPLPPGTYPSGNTYLLGTDFRGRDILTQLFWGTRVAFIVGILAAVVAVGLGTLVGLIAGYYGKFVDTLLMRTTDIFLVLPFLPIVLVLSQILRPSIWVIILVIGIVGWPGIARVIRAQVLTLKERPFVDAARVAGASDLRVITFHIAPNVLPFSFLYMSLGVAGAIITEAALSFLGLGDASAISWGGTLSQVLTFGGALSAWWWLLPPGLAITLLSLGFYLLGRGFDEIVNPRLRRR